MNITVIIRRKNKYLNTLRTAQNSKPITKDITKNTIFKNLNRVFTFCLCDLRSQEFAKSPVGFAHPKLSTQLPRTGESDAPHRLSFLLFLVFPIFASLSSCSDKLIVKVFGATDTIRLGNNNCNTKKPIHLTPPLGKS
ncbi:unnamed protein product [Aphis gossypii]|uniref:Uncharacterized protein n=1 Tax=Aphis gossypii TaxID=80765 RepID=A0A9P0IYZ5_APHGO|nr:unnamed protein product [Aphis gossypii]